MPGADFVGTVPAGIQPLAFFVGMLPVNTKQPEAAAALLKFLSSEQAVPIISKAGLKPLAKK